MISCSLAHFQPVPASLGLQLLNGHIGVSNSHAQFTSERRQKLDRNIGLALTQRAKGCLTQSETYEVFVSRDGGRARPAVKKCKLTKDCARGKAHKPNALLIVRKMHARAAPGN